MRHGGDHELFVVPYSIFLSDKLCKETSKALDNFTIETMKSLIEKSLGNVEEAQAKAEIERHKFVIGEHGRISVTREKQMLNGNRIAPVTTRLWLKSGRVFSDINNEFSKPLALCVHDNKICIKPQSDGLNEPYVTFEGLRVMRPIPKEKLRDNISPFIPIQCEQKPINKHRLLFISDSSGPAPSQESIEKLISKLEKGGIVAQPIKDKFLLISIPSNNDFASLDYLVSHHNKIMKKFYNSAPEDFLKGLNLVIKKIF